ncbi:hypothetical protein Tco_1285715 [Tanacetum coccineum]
MSDLVRYYPYYYLTTTSDFLQPLLRLDTPVIPIETPIIAPTIPLSPDYTPASPDYSHASDSESDPSEDPSSGTFTTITAISHFYHRVMTPQTVIHQIQPPSLPMWIIRFSILDASSEFFFRDIMFKFHSSLDLLSTSAGPSCKRRRSHMTFVPVLSPVSRALSPVRADLIPSPKRVKDSGYLADVEVDPREISLRDDAIVRVSDEPHLEQDIDPEIQVEIGRVYCPYAVLVWMSIPEPAQEGAVEATYETLGDLVQSWKRITRGLKGTASVKSQRVDRLQGGMSQMPNTRSGSSMTHEEVEELVTRRVAEEMEAREAARTLEPLNENGDEQEAGNEEMEMVEMEERVMDGMHGPDGEDKVKVYWRFTDNIQGNVIACELARLQDAIRIANLMKDKKVQGYVFQGQNTSVAECSRAYYGCGNNKEGDMLGIPLLQYVQGCTMKGVYYEVWKTCRRLDIYRDCLGLAIASKH